jgi:hypothetical protein
LYFLFFIFFVRAERCVKGVFFMPTYKTAESVSPKHPDKICDQISDAILDAHLKEDPDARVAVDVAGGHGTVFITGEVTARANVALTPIVKRIAGNVKVIEHMASQSSEIAAGVDTGGAGGLLSARFITKNNYTKTLMRLHGWNGGGHAVWVRVYADGRIIPDRDSSVVQCSADLPAIHWDPCKGKERTHVIVRGQVYQV